MPGNDASATLAYGQMGVLPQLKKPRRSGRTSPDESRLRYLQREDQALFRDRQPDRKHDRHVGACEAVEADHDVFAEAGVGNCPIGYATIEVRTAGGMIWAYGSVVDTVPATRRRFRCSSSS